MSGGISALNAGDLDSQITVWQPTDTPNGRGGTTTTWATIGTPYAEIIGQDGREAVIGQALQGISTYRIRIRWRSGITTKCQIALDDGTVLNVKSATDPTGRREQLMIIADTSSVQAMPTA